MKNMICYRVKVDNLTGWNAVITIVKMQERN